MVIGKMMISNCVNTELIPLNYFTILKMYLEVNECSSEIISILATYYYPDIS